MRAHRVPQALQVVQRQATRSLAYTPQWTHPNHLAYRAVARAVGAASFGRGVNREASGSFRSSASADAPAAIATAAAARNAAIGETLSTWMPTVAPSASPTDHDSPIDAM